MAEKRKIESLKKARVQKRMRQNYEDSGKITMKRSENASGVEDLRNERNRNRKFKKGNRMIVVLSVVLVLVFFFSAGMFVTVSREHFYPSYIMELSRLQLMRFFRFITGAGAEGGIEFVTYRYVMIVMAGACLAASGTVYQGTFKNILASPTTLGVMSGGNLGNILYALFFVPLQTITIKYSDSSDQAANLNLFSRNLQSFMVMLGCFAAVGIVVGITLILGKGKLKSNNLIITGIIFSSIIGSFSSLVQYYLIESNPTDPRINIIRNMMMGGFANAYKFDQMMIMMAFLLPCVLILICMSGRMDILALGDDQARTMGVNATLFKNLIIAVNTIMTAVVISFCGQIGFIGFMIPIAARRLVGPGFRRLLPAAMLMGATLLIVIYDIALMTSMTGYMNVLTSALGSIIMVIALLKGGGVSRAD